MGRGGGHLMRASRRLGSGVEGPDLSTSAHREPSGPSTTAPSLAAICSINERLTIFANARSAEHYGMAKDAAFESFISELSWTPHRPAAATQTASPCT